MKKTKSKTPSAPGGLRRHASSIAILVLAAGAGVYVAVTSDNVSTDERDLRKDNLFEAWRRDDITRVTVDHSGVTTTLRSSPPDSSGTRTWEVEIGGTRYPAEEHLVHDLLQTLEFARWERPADPDNRARYGLEPPRDRIELEMGALTFELKLGAELETGTGQRYAEVGSRLGVITSDLAKALIIDPVKLRSRSFVPYLSIDLKGLQIEGESGNRKFRRAAWQGGKGAGFQFDGGPNDGQRVDETTLDVLFQAFGRMEASEFVDDGPADANAKPVVTITMLPDEGEAGKIEVGGQCPSDPELTLAVRRSPTRENVCIKSELVETLVRPAEDYLDDGVIGADLDQITVVELREGDRIMDLARSGGAFKLREPTAREVSMARGRDVLAAMVAARGTPAEVSADEAGLNPPHATLTVLSTVYRVDSLTDTTERKEEIQIGRTEEGVTYVRRLEDGLILAVDRDLARGLLPSELSLRDPAVFPDPIPGHRLRRLEIKSTGRDQIINQEPNGALSIEKPATSLGPDGRGVAALVAAVGGLQAERWVASKDDGTFGFERPRMTIEVTGLAKAGEPPPVQRVILGAKTDRGSYAKTSKDGAVFVVSSEFELNADQWLVSRTPFSFAESDLVGVTLSSAELSASARRRGGVWLLEENQKPVAGTEQRAAELKDAALDLEAEGMVDLGPPSDAFGFASPTATLTLEFEDRDPMVIDFGTIDAYRRVTVYYARRRDMNATFAIARSRVDALSSGMPSP